MNIRIIIKKCKGCFKKLFNHRARYDVIEFSNCHTKEQSEAEFFCAV